MEKAQSISVTTKIPRRDLGLRAGDYVSANECGDGIVVGFSSLSAEPIVYFYSQQDALCIAHEELKRL